MIALLALVALALRGYLPGSDGPAERERPSSSPLALIADIVLLSAAVAIIGFAIIARLRDRQARPATRGQLPRGSGGRTGRPTWRFALIALGLIIGWLVLVLLLTRVGVLGPVEAAHLRTPTTVPDPTTTPPDTSATEESPPSEPPEPGTNVFGYLVPPMLILMVSSSWARRSPRAGSGAAGNRTRSPRDVTEAPTQPRRRRNHSLAQQNSGWPRSATSAANRGRRSSRVTRRWSAS